MVVRGLAERLSLPVFSLFQIIFDWIFPPLCVHCGQEGQWLCPASTAALRELQPQRVDLVPQVEACILGSYDHPVLGTLVRALKYRGWHALSPALSIALRPLAEALPALPRGTVIAPVPLHPRRRRERGFNQSELLAEALRYITRYPTQPCIQRRRYTRPQVGLTAEQRSTNLSGAFQINPCLKIPGCVILVDDVITTGATLKECADVLYAAGVSRVLAVGLAKG